MSILVASITGLLAFAGALLGQILSRRGARELETRSRREETMRNLRWAAELAVAQDDRRAQLGVSQLRALGASNLLDEEQQVFVDAALDAVLSEPVGELDHAEASGESAEVVLTTDDVPGHSTEQREDLDLPSRRDREEKE